MQSGTSGMREVHQRPRQYGKQLLFADMLLNLMKHGLDRFGPSLASLICLAGTAMGKRTF
jgi:hypothetical protein